MVQPVIKYEDLCPVGKVLNGGSLGKFITHVIKCKECHKEIYKQKKEWNTQTTIYTNINKEK